MAKRTARTGSGSGGGGRGPGLVMRMLRTNALSRGVFGGSRPWLAVAGLIWGGKAVRKAFGRQTGVIWSAPIAEGETVTVHVTPRRTRRNRRA